GVRFAGALRAGGRWIGYGGVVRRWIRLRGQSRASQNDDSFAGIVGQAFCEREYFKQGLASTNLENAGTSDCSHHRDRVALHLAHKNTDVRVLHVGAMKKFLEDKFQFARSQSCRSN